MELKNKTLIYKLLSVLLKENGGSLTLEDLTRYLDDMVNQHDVYPSFPDRKVMWHLEDHSAIKIESFANSVSRIAGSNDLINICFEPKCNGCNRDLKKLSITNDCFTFRCNFCSVDYKFKFISEVEAINQVIDDESNENKPI